MAFNTVYVEPEDKILYICWFREVERKPLIKPTERPIKTRIVKEQLVESGLELPNGYSLIRHD